MSRILLIENTNLICIKFVKTLEKHGYEQVDTISGPELTLSSNHKYINTASIVFIDCDNRENKVEDLITLVKSLNKKAKIITITSLASIPLIKEFTSYGSDDVLAKPFSDVKLMEKVFKHTTAPTTDKVGDSKPEAIIEDEGRLMPEWQDDLELGIKSIDDEHQQLIENYENLYQKMKKGEGSEYCQELVEYLEVYVEDHFRNEEEFFDGINYEAKDDHKVIHDEFKSDIARIAAEFKEGQIDSQKQVKFNLFIKNWWIHHILVEDKKYVTFYKKNQ